jgi:ketosteroid isomerase-like protein
MSSQSKSKNILFKIRIRRCEMKDKRGPYLERGQWLFSGWHRRADGRWDAHWREIHPGRWLLE